MRAQVGREIAEQLLGLATDVTFVDDVIPLTSADWNEKGGVIPRQVVSCLKCAFDIINLPRILADVRLVAR